MLHPITTYGDLQANLTDANATIINCRSNIVRFDLTTDERCNVLWTIARLQEGLEEMVLELIGTTEGGRSSDTHRAGSVIDVRAR